MTLDDIMALAASCYSRIDPEPQWKLRQAIEQALLQAHKEGFDAALLPGSVPDAQPVAAFDQWWDSDKPELADNPYRTDSAAYWAWAGWQAATLAERERCAKLFDTTLNGEAEHYWREAAAAIRNQK